MIHTICPEKLHWHQFKAIANKPHQLKLSAESEIAILNCRNYLEQSILGTDRAVYGINTGFGALCRIRIAPEEQETLQQNLVRSHACGAGEPVPIEIVRWMLLLKIHSLALGHSGICLETIQRLIDFYNANVTPVVYKLGSLGASGDLVPLAHLSLPLMGEGEVWINDQKISAADLEIRYGWKPLKFKAKEGLALLNGTQFMQAFGIWALLQSERLLTLFNTVAAISLEGWSGRIDAFHPSIHATRPFAGQKSVAATMIKLLENSSIASEKNKNVQDPYSFRCIPQVHGASADTLNYVRSIFETEANSVTDNPLIFPNEDLVLSGGNFHGQPLALGLDFLAIAMSELGSISERRTFQLLSGARNLPEFLVGNSGLNSGLMIPQYMAASLVSQNRQLCTPASADSVVSSNGQEDHVSMGANAALKLHQIIGNLYDILSVELITAAQAVSFRRPLRSSDIIENLLGSYRQQVDFISSDRYLYPDLVKTRHFLYQLNLAEYGLDQ